MKLFFIFWASWDLAKRKILPALQMLQKEKKLEDFKVFWLSRTAYSNEDFRKYLIDWVWEDENFLQNVFYESFDASKPEDFEKLNAEIKSLGENTEIFYYLSVAPSLLENILPGLKNLPTWKIIVEKPLGYDLESAKHLNSLLSDFDEKNIFRIDHYLWKPAIQQNINFFDSKILKIEVSLAESLWALGRQYYDQAWVVRDMIQNHALNTLAKIVSPENKYEFLKSLSVEKYILGQYQGYRDEDNISDISTTPTYAKVFLKSSLEKFEDIDFVLESWKSMKEKKSVVKIYFDKTFSSEENKFDNEYISFQDNILTFNLDKNWDQAYKNLIEKVILWDKKFFVSNQELETAWEIIDPILKDINIQQYNIGFEWF